MTAAKTGKAKLNVISTLCNQIVTTICGVLIPHIVISAFGSEAYGITVSITQFLSYIMLLESGIGGVARAELYGPLAKNDMDEVSSVYRAILNFFRYVAAAFLIYSIVIGLTFYDIADVTIFSRPYIFALVMVISLATLAKYMGGLANLTLIVADQKLYINNAIMIATTIAKTVFVFLLVHLDADLLWVKLGSSLIFLVRPILYAVYVRKHYRLTEVKKSKTALKQKWTGIGQHIAYFLHTNTDIVLLTLFADVKLVAVYSVYSLVIKSVYAIAQSFSGGMEAAFGEMIANGQLEKLQGSYKRYKTLISSASGVLFSCTGILIISFVRLYTNGITDADYIQPLFALILMISEAANCIVLPCSSLPIAANHLKQTRWGAYGEALINIAVSCALISWNPLVGVALGTLTATLFRGVFYMVYSGKNILHIPYEKIMLRFLCEIAAIGVISIVGYRLLQHAVITNYFQWFLWGAIVFALISAPVLLACRKRLKDTGK